MTSRWLQEPFATAGLFRARTAPVATAQTLTNDASGTWLSGGALTLNGNQLTNSGQLQGDTLTGNSLDNRGVMNGIQELTGTVQGALNNDGQMVSRGDATLNADSLTGSGRIVADTLTLQAKRLTNNGLWQGTKGLTATGDTFTTGANARARSAVAIFRSMPERLTPAGRCRASRSM
ncbi:Uncharacterised protein [Cronobacter sakazakii]|nr:Uncharacterised protein [Cronobacter sakazakii]